MANFIQIKSQKMLQGLPLVDPSDLRDFVDAVARKTQSAELHYAIKQPQLPASQVQLRRVLALDTIIQRTAVTWQVHGQLVPEPCDNCQSGRGPFTSCVCKDDFMQNRCANCYYSGERCSLERRKPTNPQRRIALLKSATVSDLSEKNLPSKRPIESSAEYDTNSLTKYLHAPRKFRKLVPSLPLSTVGELPQSTEFSGKFVLFGNLALPDPAKADLSPSFLQLIEDVKPHLMELESRDLNNLLKPIEDMDIAWTQFKQLEKNSWVAAGQNPMPEALLVKPSGSLNSPLCHHLHQPSYSTEFLENGQAADRTNGSIAMVMGNGYKEGETLIFDHLHRRDPESHGLSRYDQTVLDCHADFTQMIRESSTAKVEIVYGEHVQRSLLQNTNTEHTILPLWGPLDGVILALSHESNYRNAQSRYKYRKILLLAAHPQALFYAKPSDIVTIMQERIILAAVAMTGASDIPVVPEYFTKKKWRHLQRNSLAGIVNQRNVRGSFRKSSSQPSLPSMESLSNQHHVSILAMEDWNLHFDKNPHSNDTLRELLPPALEAVENHMQHHPIVDWIHPTEFPTAVLKWFKGQNPILFRHPITRPIDIALVVKSCIHASETNIEPIPIMFMKLMEKQTKILSTTLGRHQNLWHSSFDDESIATKCEKCGVPGPDDLNPRWHVRRPGVYLARQSRQCISESCRGTCLAFQPADTSTPWVIYRYGMLLSMQSRKAPNWEGLIRLPDQTHSLALNVVEIWCINCRDETQLKQDPTSNVFLDEIPRWTMGKRRPLYIERRVACKRCEATTNRAGRFIPKDPSIPSITMQNIRKFATRFSSFPAFIQEMLLDNWPASSKIPRCSREIDARTPLEPSKGKSSPTASNVEAEVPGKKKWVRPKGGLDYLISDLEAGGLKTEEAVQICRRDVAFTRKSFREWLDVPPVLRNWLRNQPSLRVSGQLISSTEELRETHRMLCRKYEEHTTTINENGSHDVALDIAIRYFQQIRGIGMTYKSVGDDASTQQEVPVARKCGNCGSRLLDDAFPRYTNDGVRKYICRYLKGCCGLPLCKVTNVKSCYAVPVDPSVLHCRRG